jgi:antitoxin FitA
MEAVMATLTIRNLDENVKRELRKHAAEHGVSMEEEARRRLAQSLEIRPRRKSILADLERLAIKPNAPFDMKKTSDEMWDESFE